MGSDHLGHCKLVRYYRFPTKTMFVEVLSYPSDVHTVCLLASIRLFLSSKQGERERGCIVDLLQQKRSVIVISLISSSTSVGSTFWLRVSSSPYPHVMVSSSLLLLLNLFDEHMAYKIRQAQQILESLPCNIS